MATLAALTVAAQTAKLNEVAIAAATAEAKLDQAELDARRADEAHRREVRVAAAQKAAETRQLNKAYAPLKAVYDSLYTEAIRLQGAVAALSQVCDAASVAGTFSLDALKLLQEKKAETEARFREIDARGLYLHNALPEHLRNY